MQCYEFHSVPAGTDGKSRTGLQTGMRPSCSTSEKISAYSGVFRAFRSISVNSVEIKDLAGTHFGLSLLKRKITATRSSIEEMKKKGQKKKKKKVMKAWSTAGVREKIQKKKQRKKRRKEIEESTWAMEIEETLELWKWEEEERAVRWVEK